MGVLSFEFLHLCISQLGHITHVGLLTSCSSGIVICGFEIEELGMSGVIGCLEVEFMDLGFQNAWISGCLHFNTFHFRLCDFWDSWIRDSSMFGPLDIRCQ